MGYMVAFCPEEDDADLELGDQFATNSGYAAFLDWLDTLGPEYDALLGLAEEGCAVPGELLDDLDRVLSEKPGKPSADVLGVARALRDAVRDAPPGTAAIGVTDGEA
jgi:hypothetical protein